MNTTAILLLVLIVVVITVGAILFWQRRRSAALQQKFGPEYQRAVGQFGDQRKAEAELAAREKRVRRLEIRPLTPAEEARFTQAWKKAQARFVDEPSQAAAEADILVKELMETRGYPMGDFEQRGGRYFSGSPQHGEQLSRGARDRAAQQRREGNNGRYSAGDGPLSLAV